MILLLSTLPPALGQEHRGSRGGARHGSNLLVRGQPLTCHDCRERTHEGGHEHPHVLLP